VASHRADAVIVDYEMAGHDGEAVRKLIKANWPELPVILFQAAFIAGPRQTLCRCGL